MKLLTKEELINTHITDFLIINLPEIQILIFG